jgi:hypothetical protein
MKKEHQKYFVKVLKMIDTMNNLSNEDIELDKNLHGYLTEEQQKAED